MPRSGNTLKSMEENQGEQLSFRYDVLQETETGKTHPAPGEPPGLFVVRNDRLSEYEAIIGDECVGALAFESEDDRIVLLSTTTCSDFRGQGIATALIQRALNDLRAHRQRITVECSLVRTYIDRNPEYELLVHPFSPGL